MLPTNVMSFVKKMVNAGGEDGLRERSPLRHPTSLVGSSIQDIAATALATSATATTVLPSSRVTAVAVVEKAVTSPVPEGADMSHLTSEEITILQKVFEKQQQFEKEEASRMKVDGGSKPMAAATPVCRSNACRICLRGLQGADDVFHVCCECQQKVCEDCSSYSQQGNAKDTESWKCSICRRKHADMQKLQDPEVTSIILQRTASRKKQSASGNQEAGSGVHDTPPTSRSSTPFGADRIETTPKLRPKTLDTSPGYSSTGDQRSAHGRSSSGQHHQQQQPPPQQQHHHHHHYDDQRDRSHTGHRGSKDTTSAGASALSRSFGDKAGASSNSTDSAPQTPTSRPSRDDSRTRSYATWAGNQRNNSLEVIVVGTSTEGSSLPRRSSTRRSSPRHGEHCVSDADGTSTGGDSHQAAALRPVHSEGVTQHRLSPNSVRDRCSPRPRHSPSTSDSSLDDGWSAREQESRDQDVHWKRKKSKIKRRTRIQRQRSYHEELEQQKQQQEHHQHQDAMRDLTANFTSPEDINREDDDDEAECGGVGGGDYDLVHDCRHNPREQLLDVPGHSRIYRHHSWDASLSANRRYSSESSDISDVSLDYPGSLDQDEPTGSFGLSGAAGGISPLLHSPLLKPKSVRKLARKKRVDIEDDYDAEQSATMESSPSPDHPDRHFHVPHLDRRTSSEDSEVFKGNRSRKSSQNNIVVVNVANVPGSGSGSASAEGSASWSRKIPTVEVHVADHEAVAFADRDSQPIKCEVGVAIERSGSISGIGGRALPKIPSQQQLQQLASSSSSTRLTPVLPSPVGGCPRTRQSKSVDLTPLCHSSTDRSSENLLRRSTLSDFENVRIVIDDVDSDRKDRPTIQRKVLLSRLPVDSVGHRTRGFGMRVVGGKIGEDGKLFAYVVWTVPGGPAEENGIVKGDKILEWNGETLIDRTFEEVCSIMDHSGDEVALIVEHVIDPRNCLTGADFIQRRASEGSQILMKESMAGVSPPMRRKLPQPPAKDTLSGEIQLMLWFDADQKLLTITVVEADSLPVRNDAGKTPPQAYAKIRLLPDKNKCTFKTPISEPSSSPTWNENFNYIGVTSDDVVEKFLVVSVWDMVSSKEKVALGEVVVQLKKCELDGRPEWYRLRDGCALTTSASISSLSKSLHVRPFPSSGQQQKPSSLSSSHLVQPRDVSSWKKRADFLYSRSLSDDIDDDLALELIGHIVKSTSVDSNLLHPDGAYNRQGRRRSSSGSEKDQSDASTHSCPQSLPSTRKNSFNLEPHPDYASSTSRDNKLRSRSIKGPSSKQDHMMRLNKESIADVALNVMKRNSLATDRLSRSLSLKVDRRSLSLVNVSNLSLEIPPYVRDPAASLIPKDDLHHPPPTSQTCSSPKEYLALPTRGKWSSSSSLEASDEDEYCSAANISGTDNAETMSASVESSLHLGPGQMAPKNFTGIIGSNQREIKLGLIITKGFLEIDVICARGLGYSSTGQPPDTYVKMYLKDGDKRMQKKKTRVVRHSMDPQYRQTLTYPAGEANGRFLLVMVWERQKGFDHNHGIGAAQIDPGKLELNNLVIGWYRLFPMGKIESESNESA